MSFPVEILTSISEDCDKEDARHQTEDWLDDIDAELVVVWKEMERFCSVINRSARSKRKLSEATLLQAMASVMYRLLHSSWTFRSFEEALRLALLAFCAQVFLPKLGLNIQDTALSSTYRECLIHIVSSARISSRVSLWFQMVGAVAVFGVGDHVWLGPLLRSSIKRCGIGSWDELAKTMQSFIWIGLLFDGPGEKFFDSMMAN